LNPSYTRTDGEVRTIPSIKNKVPDPLPPAGAPAQ
jgi:hypothetical protein